MSINNISQSDLKEIKEYCKLNNISDTDTFIKSCFDKGYYLEKYGLLDDNGKPKIIEKEVIKEVIIEVEKPVIEYVDVIREIEIVREVPVEKIVIKEVTKEIPVEKIVTIYDNSGENELLSKIQQLEISMSKKVEEMDKLYQTLDKLPIEKIVQVNNNSKEIALQETLQKLKKDNIGKDKKIKELENELTLLLNSNEKKGIFLRGSNLGDTLYK